MKKYHITFDFNGEPREQSFDTKSERDKVVKELKGNRSVRAISFYELTESDPVWTRPADDQKADA